MGGFDEYMWVVWLTESHHWIEWMNHQSILFQWMSMTDGWFNQPIIPPSISLVFSAWSSKETHKTLLKVDRTRVIQLWDWAGWKRDWMWSLKWKEGSVVQDESLSFFTNLLQNDAAFSQSWNTAAKYVHVMQWTAIFIFCHKFLRNMCSIQVFMLIKTILWLKHKLCCRNDGTESYWHWQHSLDGVKSTACYKRVNKRMIQTIVIGEFFRSMITIDCHFISELSPQSYKEHNFSCFSISVKDDNFYLWIISNPKIYSISCVNEVGKVKTPIKVFQYSIFKNSYKAFLSF